MNPIIIFVLIREDNQQYLGAYPTREQAEQMALAYRIPVEILVQYLFFPHSPQGLENPT